MFTGLFRLDNLSMAMIGLIASLGLTLAFFARTYLAGEPVWQRFFAWLVVVISCQILWVASNHAWLFWLSGLGAQIAFSRLLALYHNWPSAQASANTMLKTVLSAQVILGCCFLLLHHLTHTWSLFKWVHDPTLPAPVVMVMVACLLSQTALWPAHRWLVGTANTPSPVSALLHAGLINGSGYVLTRWLPWIHSYDLSTILCVAGCTSAVLGTLFKCLQSDVKRQLACSTIAQMGYMVLQCGLGLVGAAMLHVIGHACFKARLFLSAPNSAWQHHLSHPHPSPTELGWALVGAFTAIAVLAQSMAIQWHTTEIFLALMVALSGAQLMLHWQAIAERPQAWGLIGIALLTDFYAHLIGISDTYLVANQPQPLTWIHGMLALPWPLLWLLLAYRPNAFWQRMYLPLLRNSQPPSSTLTPNRYEAYHAST